MDASSLSGSYSLFKDRRAYALLAASSLDRVVGDRRQLLGGGEGAVNLFFHK
jgi:hypothetical protein